MDPQEDRSFRGAYKVVSTCLCLVPGQELLIFADETTLEAAQYINRAATHHRINSTILLVPLEDQVRYAGSGDFPLLIQAPLREARAILTCVNDQPEAMNFRAGIIRQTRGFQAKIGNCPGMNLEMLSTAIDVDYPAMVHRCHLLALVLVKSKNMEIITKDNQEKEQRLRLSLGHWERVPVTSTGIIEMGTWGNIPSGETYSAPLENTAEGEIIINGSIPGYVFAKGEEIKLTFRGGELVSIVPDKHPAAQLLQARLKSARLAGYQDSSHLGEVGIGVNPGIKRLTGKPLMDEKKDGTAHIALGNNKDFGGELVSSVHLDLVTESPTIKLDGKTILREGKLVIRERDWRESYATVAIPEGWPEMVRAVSRTGHKTNPRNPRSLERELIDGTGRIFYVPVGDNPTASMAAAVYGKISNRESTTIAELMADAEWDRLDLLRILRVMQDYEMVKLHGV